MAASAPAALVIVRGSSDWVHLVGWDTSHDTITPGAWFHGRIDAPRCDLSPDGRLLVCKLYKGNRASTEYTDCGTAISRSPWLHALAVWPMGTTYGGGGRFVGEPSLVLRGRRAIKNILSIRRG